MPDLPTPQTQPPQTPPAAPPSTPPPAGAEPTPVTATGFRFPNDDSVPAYLRGRTAAESVTLFQQMESALVHPGPLSAPTASPPPQAPPQGAAQPPNPDLAYSDPAGYQRALLAYNEQRTADMLLQGATPLFQQNATNARALSRMDAKLADVWTKYGPEIDVQVAQVPLHMRTKDMYDMAAELVRGRHVDEIAQERAQRIAATIVPATDAPSPYGAAPSGGARGDEIDALFASDSPAVKHFRDAGMSPSDVRAHAARMGHTPKAYAEMIQRSSTLASDRPLAVSNR